ncbi:MAG: tRNA (uridine(54)-C5)-methyltransferase TrmA [Cellvibrionaceae bacterium]
MPYPYVLPEQYQQQLDEKVLRFTDALEQLGPQAPSCSLDILTSPLTHYRLRAEFKIWHEGNRACYAMTDPETKKPVFIDDFPVAAKNINTLMAPLLEAINSNEILRKKCFQAEFLTTLTEDTVVTLIYHKALNEDWIEAIQSVKEKLNINIIGRSRKQKIVLDRDYVTETLSVNKQQYHYKQIEGGFTQPNGRVCEKMLSWAVDKSQSISGDLLELYCGNGNFTIPLSKNFNQVIATEIAKTSVNAAHDNLQLNNIDNVKIARMSSEEFVQAIDKVREFRRLKDITLDDYHFSTVFVDPPRAGLDLDTVKMVQRFDNIIYISCNPTTLIDNLKALCQTHKIDALAAFDQFPYTDHLETGVILSSR